MIIRAFVIEFIWRDILEVIVYFKVNNCYMSLKIFCFIVKLKSKNYFIFKDIIEKYI